MEYPKKTIVVIIVLKYTIQKKQLIISSDNK